ncbi:MAG: response regulator [Pseudomonadota bacterium]
MVATVSIARAAAALAPPVERQVNILIVDDLDEKHVVMSSVLEELGQNIVSARSGREALKLILQMEFAVILLDVNMPDIDGLETASLIRQYKKTAQTPILFITSYVDELQVARGYALGAVDYISSPVIPDILRSKVKVFVDLYRMQLQLQQQAVAREALARSEMARAAAEEATQRADYLSDVSQRLSLSLNLDDTIRAMADVAVPALGRMAAVVLQDAQGELVCRGFRMQDAHAGPGAVACHHTPDPAAAQAVRAVLQSESIEFFEPAAVWGSWPGAGAGAKGMPAGVPQGVEKMLACPLMAGEQKLGALLLFGGADDFPGARTALIREFAGRASIAMENARLYSLVREADRRKNEFLAMLAHELRNPLAPIRNAVHIIHGAPVVDPKVAWARDVIGHQVDHMSRMVDDLLDISRIVRGKVTVQAEALLLSSLCERAVEASKPLLDGRQQTLEVLLPAENVVLQGDLVRLSQVLSNLLNNASKFTPLNGHVSLVAEFLDDGVSITVTDNGQGIDPEFLPHIFELFVQGDQALDRAQGGLGIGLTLVRHLVELHAGRVEARSEGKGKGTSIRMHFPASLAEGAGLALTPPPAPARPAVASSRRVMVVDDLAASADTLQVLLEMEGFDVRVANDGVAALELARQFRPEVVILDIGLPGMDGFEVARRLREQPESKHTVLIALTGYGEAESRLRSRQAGFDHHIVKPADIDELLCLVGETPLESSREAA